MMRSAGLGFKPYGVVATTTSLVSCVAQSTGCGSGSCAATHSIGLKEEDECDLASVTGFAGLIEGFAGFIEHSMNPMTAINRLKQAVARNDLILLVDNRMYLATMNIYTRRRHRNRGFRLRAIANKKKKFLAVGLL